MDVSVIICTYNRARELRRTLESFRGLRINGLAWELLVMDNNSQDDTRAVCDGFKDALPIRYLFEGRQGKSVALNRAVVEAAAPLLLFTDDDVSVTPDWMLNLHDAAERYPEMSFFGGRVLPQWDHTPPRWFVENREWLWGQPHIDYGDMECEKDHFVGANFAARKAIFQEGLFYREDFGPCGLYGTRDSRPGMEDYELQERLIELGMRGWYVSSALVYHRDPPNRMTEKYVRYWYKQKGRKMTFHDEVTSPHIWFGSPRYLWRQLLESAFLYGASRFTKPSKLWLGHEVRMAEKWGCICEFRARTKRRQ